MEEGLSKEHTRSLFLLLSANAGWMMQGPTRSNHLYLSRPWHHGFPSNSYEFFLSVHCQKEYHTGDDVRPTLHTNVELIQIPFVSLKTRERTGIWKRWLSLSALWLLIFGSDTNIQLNLQSISTKYSVKSSWRIGQQYAAGCNLVQQRYRTTVKKKKKILRSSQMWAFFCFSFYSEMSLEGHLIFFGD